MERTPAIARAGKPAGRRIARADPGRTPTCFTLAASKNTTNARTQSCTQHFGWLWWLCVLALVLLGSHREGPGDAMAARSDVQPGQSVVEWFGENFGPDDMRWVQLRSEAKPYSNYVLSLAAGNDVVWAGTTNGFLRLDRTTGDLTKVFYEERLSAANLERYLLDAAREPAGEAWEWPATGPMHLRNRVVELLKDRDGRLWAKGETGLRILDADGQALAEYMTDFEAVEALSSSRVFGDSGDGPVSRLYAHDQEGRFYLHWPGCPKAAVYTPDEGWALWEFPATVLSPGGLTVTRLSHTHSSRHVLVHGEGYLFDAGSRLVAGDFPTVDARAVGESSVCLAGGAVILRGITPEALTDLRLPLALWSWDAGLRQQLVSLPFSERTWRLLVAERDGDLYACGGDDRGATGEMCVIRDINRVHGSTSARLLEIGELPLGPAGEGYITALFASSDGVLWLGTTHGARAMREGEEIVTLHMSPSDSPAPPDPSVTRETGVQVTAMDESPDGVLWFGTHRGIASYDGERVQWYATGEQPHPSRRRDAEVAETPPAEALATEFTYEWDTFDWPPELEAKGVRDLYMEGVGLLSDPDARSRLPWAMEEGMEALDQVIAAWPQFAAAYLNRGLARAVQDDLEGALQDLDRAIELREGYGLAYCNRGIVRAKMGRLPEALRDFDRAVELSPRYPPIYTNRAHALRMKGDTRAAERDLQKAAELSRP